MRKISPYQREKITAALKGLLEGHKEILFAYLHGSFAEGVRFRDVDVAVFVDEDLIERGRALDFEISISLELQGALEAPIDVKVINYAPLAFQYYCTTGTLLMCRNDDIRVDF